MDELRQANISIVVFVVITAIGVFAFRNAGEAALQLVGIASFIITFAVYFVLLRRAERQEKDPQ